MKTVVRVLFVAFNVLEAQVAPPQMPPRQDSVDVSANISKKQLERENQLDRLLAQAEKDRSQDDFASALIGFRKALATVRSEPLLREQEDRVLSKVSRAYLEVKQPEEAVRSYAALLELRKDDCRPDAKEIERCAEAQCDLGLAQMYRGDFSAAVSILREAVTTYGTAASGDHLEEYRMIKLKQRAEAQTLLATALFRTGRRSDALGILDSAIKQLDTVQRNENIQDSIRASARSGLRQAEQVLGALKDK